MSFDFKFLSFFMGIRLDYAKKWRTDLVFKQVCFEPMIISKCFFYSESHSAWGRNEKIL